MKIAVIGQKHMGSSECGIEQAAACQAAELAARGHRILALDRKGHHLFGKQYDEVPRRRTEALLSEARREHGDREKAGSITVRPVFCPRGAAGTALYSFLAVLAAVRNRCDLALFHGSGISVAILPAKLLGLRCAAMLHGFDSERAKWNRIGRLYLSAGERIAAKRADVCFVLSEHMRDVVRERYGAEAVVVTNGIPMEGKTPGTESGMPSAEGGTAVPEKGSYILSLSRLVPEKGIHFLIEAFRGLDTEKTLLIAGGTDPGCPEYAAHLRKMAEGDKRIRFAGFVTGRTVMELYRNAFCYVLPSEVEGMAITLLEAMSAGCCVIASDIPENAEVIADAGLLFPKGSVPGLRKKLAGLLAEPAEAKERGRRAAERVKGRYSWSVCAGQMEEALQKADGLRG